MKLEIVLRRRRFDTKVRFAFHERKEGKSVFREKTNREETLTRSPSATTSSSSSSVTKVFRGVQQEQCKA